MKKNDLCFIGAGFHASTNIFPAAIEAGVNIKAIATRSIAGSSKALLRFASLGNPYNDYHKMLEVEECDGVVIVAQPKDQYNIALDCINMGKNIFVDKPLGWNTEEAKVLHELASKNNVKVMVGFMKRFAPSYMKLKDIINTQELGNARSFQLNFYVDGTAFCKNQEEFIKLAAIHVIDLINYLFEGVIEVSTMDYSFGPNINMCVMIKTNKGIIGSLNLCSMTAWSRESENISVTFENGFVKVNEINQVIIHHSKTNNELAYASQTEEDIVFTPSMTPMSGGLRDLYLRGFVGEITHFVDCLSEDFQSVSDSYSNIRTMELCDNILKIKRN